MKNVDRCDNCGRFVPECSLVAEMQDDDEPTGRSICGECDTRIFYTKQVQASDPTRFVNGCTCQIGAIVQDSPDSARIIIASEDDCSVHGFGEGEP